MMHICNDCNHKDDCKYCQTKFKNGNGQFCDNILYRKEQEERFMKKLVNLFKNL